MVMVMVGYGLEVVLSRSYLLGAIGSRWEPLGAVGSRQKLLGAVTGMTPQLSTLHKPYMTCVYLVLLVVRLLADSVAVRLIRWKRRGTVG